MAININAINNLNSSFNEKRTKESSSEKFSIPNDPVVEGIRKNVKDPIDQEEDLRFWKSCSGIKPAEGEMTYDKFLELKKEVVGFPPPSALGRVRKAYREYMDRLPKNVRDNMQGILTFTYGLFIDKKNVKTSSWGQIIGIMKEHVGEIGNSDITNFDLLSKILDDCSSFDKEQKEDESVRQILI